MFIVLPNLNQHGCIDQVRAEYHYPFSPGTTSDDRVNHHYVWLSWEETQFYARLLDLPTVPELARRTAPLLAESVEDEVLALIGQPSRFGSVDARTGFPCTMEGLVSRDAGAHPTAGFSSRVFKYVRKNHVSTTDHWTRTWQRAPLVHERKQP